jgi:hypothetical protein
MFDGRTGAMIALSLLIGSPALVFADVGGPRDETLARLADTQLTAATASVVEAAPAVEPTALLGVEAAEPGWGGQWKGVDFPVGGTDQFAHTETTGGK